MSLLTVWLRLELRRRWRSLVVLALLLALATGTVLASVAGARRGSSAVDRLAGRTLPTDAFVLLNQPGFDWDKIRALPGVTALTTIPISGMAVDGLPDDAVGGPFADTAGANTIERPVVMKGRVADPRRDDEVMVTGRFPGTYHKGVGDSVTLRLYSPAQVDSYEAGFDVDAPTGPRIKARIVGIVRSPWFSDPVGGAGTLYPSAGLFTQHRANLLGAKKSVYVNGLLRLKGGEAALPKFRADLARVTGRTDVEIWNNADKARHAQKVDSFESACLLAFGIAALVAAVVLVGQTVARYTAATVVDLQILRAVGMTPRQTTIAASVGPFLAAAAGATVGVAGAVVASAWMPIGAASSLEPAPGVDIDWIVLGTGWVVVPLIVLAGTAASARLSLAATRAQLSPRRSTIAVAAARVGLPVPIVVGTRFALERGRGHAAVPVRPALIGAVVGVLGVLAAFTFSAGVTDAVGHPERYGRTYQLEAFLGLNSTDYAPARNLLATVARDPAVEGVNNARIAVAESGNTSVTMYTYEAIGKPLRVVLTDGRMPTGSDQVVLAPTSARNLGAHVGSMIPFRGNEHQSLRVTGIGFVPQGAHNTYDDGGWLTPAGYDRLFTGFKFRSALLTLRPGADIATVIPRLIGATKPLTGRRTLMLWPPQRPDQIGEIRDVRTLPIVLGGFLLLLALGAVGHALATAVRRRRHDMAVLRALGLTRWQSRGVIITQATVLAAVGVTFGIPLGLALARILWHEVAANTPLAYHPPLAAWALALIVPLALILANLLAAWPGQRAARIHVGQTLRTE